METTKHISLWHLIAGVVMVLLGVFLWFNPAASLLALALYLGIAFIVIGLGYISASFASRSSWYLLVGILDLMLGIIFTANVGLTAATLPVLLAIWCIAVGSAQIISAFRLKNDDLPWGWSLTAGLLGLCFGLWILAYPVVGTVTLSALIGSYFLLYGIVEIIEYASNRREPAFG